MHGRPEPSTRPILLVGMPGAGKSTVGAVLARQLGLAFHDSDAIIEAESGLDVAAFFRTRGEARFRTEERQTVERLLKDGAAVIAAGGGAFLDREIRALALQRAAVIWLDAPCDTLAERLDVGAVRPLLAGDLHGRLAALRAERDPVYALAPLRIDATPEPDLVATAIITSLAELAR